MGLPKSEVYSWRVSPALKSRLEDEARRQQRTVAAMLDELVLAQLDLRNRERGVEDERQRELQASAAAFAGRLAGTDPQRATHARAQVRARLRARHGARR